MGSVPNCRKEIADRYPIRWFKCKLKPPKKDEELYEPEAGFKKFHKDYGTYFMSFFADYRPFYNEVY